MLADHANVREAAEDAMASGDEVAAVTLALGSRPMWLAGMLRQEAQELTERMLERFEIPGDQEVALVRAAAYLDYSPSAKAWHRRLASVAARIGDHEALAMATGNLFGQALNASWRSMPYVNDMLDDSCEQRGAASRWPERLATRSCWTARPARCC
jgi:hypothetical protein